MESPVNSSSALRSARLVTAYLLREPVKDAVREALHEERVRIERTERGTSPDSGGGGSKLGLLVTLVALGAIVYAVRRRRRSDSGWSSGTRSDRIGGSHHEEPGSGSTGGGTGEPGSSTVSDDF